MNAPLVYAILLAAGSGSRLGANLPKAFVKVQGRSILLRSFEILQCIQSFAKIIVTVPVEMKSDPEVAEVMSRGGVAIVGGATRRESVSKALEKVRTLVGSDAERSFVLIHDAARCFVTKEIIERTLSAVFESDAVTTGVPSIDSIKVVNSAGIVERSLDRSALWIVQTPQAFRFPLIERAHREFQGEATDDASMVERFSEVRMIQGAPSNRKITVPEDL